MRRRAAVATVAATAVLLSWLPATPASAETPTPPPPQARLRDKPARQLSQNTDTIIVTFERNQDDPAQAATDVVDAAAGQVAGADIVAVTPITPKTVAVTLDQTITAAEAAEIGDQAEDQAGVRAAEPSATLTTSATTDEYYSYLWNLRAGSASQYSVDAETAWPTSTGSSVIVGVIDTGITSHPDLNANLVAGYDFIADRTRAGDGNGRDSNPADPGDYCDEDGERSSWHGTHVAGIIAAIRNNGIGVVGVAPGAKVEALRALGRCGGAEADIIAAVRWGAGLTVTGLPVNTKPVDVLNLSLGGVGLCSTAMQDAINAAVTKGVAVVVAAGNENRSLGSTMPGNCKNVIRVTSSTFEGRLAPYSNYGTTTDPATIAAPGGSGLSDVDGDWILSTWNNSTRLPGPASYAWMVGTSMAAPHVAAVAALLKAKDRSLTPGEIEALMVGTATPLPGCSAARCGSGVVNAPAALNALVNNPLKSLSVTVAGNSLVGRSLVASVASAPNTTYAYQWLRNDSPIVGANATSYTLTPADAGTAVSARVTATYVGLTASTTSQPLAVYATFADSVPTPVITGDAMAGGTLLFGFDPSTLGTDTVQWFRDGAELDAAPSIAVGDEDIGHEYTVSRQVSFEGEQVTRTSAPVTIVANSVTNLATPVIDGPGIVGGRLSTTGAGATGATYSYQWLRNGTAISGATGASLLLGPADLAAVLSVTVTASHLGRTASMTSVETPAVVAGRFTTRVAPRTSGTYKKGRTVKAYPGTWSPAPATVKYRWLRNGASIAGATSSRYKLTSRDKGKYISVRVTVYRAGYITKWAYSSRHKVR